MTKLLRAHFLSVHAVRMAKFQLQNSSVGSRCRLGASSIIARNLRVQHPRRAACYLAILQRALATASPLSAEMAKLCLLLLPALACALAPPPAPFALRVDLQEAQRRAPPFPL